MVNRNITRFVQLGLCAMLGLSAQLLAERPYFNDLRAPENEADVKAIQDALMNNLQQARDATVHVLLEEGSGSGVIISEDGLVLSAAHVTGGVDQKLKIQLEDGREYEAVSLGLNSENDASMLQIVSDEKFPFVKLEGKVEDYRPQSQLGDWVFAIGHSGGFDKERGAVVRLGRIVRVAKDTVGSDCVLIGGDSGGPLFDINGELIGIHSRVGRLGSQNMHVPVQAFYKSWDQMKAGEFLGDGPFAKKSKPGSGFMGVAVAETKSGLEITAVEPKCAADIAGLKKLDILLELGGKPVATKKALQDELKKLSAGDRVMVKYSRGDKVTEVEMELKEK